MNIGRAVLQSALRLVVVSAILLSATSIQANLPGGGTGTGANVTLTDNGSTVTIANGIVSILCTKSGATINQINYTFNNGGGLQTINLLSGGNDGGQLYWELGGFGGSAFAYTLVANPAGTGGNYAEISLLSTSATNGTMEVHFSMLRGSPGFYVTAIWAHRSVDGAMGMGETRDNIYSGSIFNWMSVDAARNRVMEVSGGSAIGVQGAPVEVSLWTSGIYSGQYEDKYKYSADLGNQHVYGWSSVGAGGKNAGLWNIQGSMEYHQNGPMKRDLMEHIGTTILNMHNSSHYGGGINDCNWSSGEVWTKVYGPYFIYCNNVTNAITGMNAAAQALFSDAQAQALAEQGIDANGQPTGATGAWPYYWFTNANYAPAAGRGAITGRMVINDAYNPNASTASLWVGVMQQPVTTTATYDFQSWMKNYQFWVKTDRNGNFTIPNVIAGANYTLYAFGPGAPGTFQSQPQTGGNTVNTKDIPTPPFSVTVTAGATNNLGTVTWTPARVGATVFEIGYPSRTGQNKFRHGDDYWVSEIYSNPADPSPIWGMFLEYPFDFPSGPDYVVGQSRWTTDWNYVQPCVVSSSGLYNDSSSTITFNLPSAPGGSASFYIALCSDYQGALEISVNGTQIAGGSGYNPNYSGSGSECDTTVREGVNANFSDNRISFSPGLLHSGQNTITVDMRQTGKVNGDGYFADHAMYDYLRLELSSYVPPAPAGVSAYPGNNVNLISWPVTPGATSYNLLRSTNSGGGYVSVASGVVGPVCGSGTNNATYLDTNAVNGTTYFYVVQSVNPVGGSANSAQSPGTTPSANLPTNAPAAPTGLSVTSSGRHSVTLNWSASPGANYYSVWRSVLVNNGGGASNTLGTIILDNTNTVTIYTDTTPTDGSIYSYFITATSAGGTSGNSAPVVAKPVPAPPAAAPASLTATPNQVTNTTLNWGAVSGAVGYVISRATSASGTFTLLYSITETTFTDVGAGSNTTYYYKVTPVNSGGIAPAALITTRPAAPAGLTATAGNAQVTLTWPASIGATGYVILQGTNSGDATNIIASGITSTNYTNTGLTNGVTYYYVVESIGSAATSGNSPQADATPFIPNLIWTGANSASWDTTTSNWMDGPTAVPYAAGDDVIFNDSAQTNILIIGAVFPSSVTFASANSTYTVNATGAGIAGATSLLKINGGTLNLPGANAYIGGTTVNGGTLVVNNTSGSATGSGAVTVGSGGTLGGSGIISGAVTVNAGGALVPGNPPGVLTINNNLTLAPGSTTFMQVRYSPPANSAVQISGALYAGGTLTVANIGGALASGDTFNLFTAGSYNGAFANVVLPLLPAGLAWNTSNLNSGGVLSVMLATTPVFGALSISGGGLALSGTGGVGNASFYLLTSTNLATPLSNWIRLLTNQFDTNGNFNFTNPIDPSAPQNFYLLQMP
jgi:fibronectin type 3 domain-containing protein